MMADLKLFLKYVVFSSQGNDIAVWQITLVPIVIIVGYLLLRLLISATTKTLEKRRLTPDAIQMVRRALYVIGLLILFITFLDLINIPLTAFAFISGAIAIGLGFGAQNIINNFISGWILMWERPIRINDFIEIDGTSGTVQEINTRSTKIHRVDGVHMLVPNSKLLEETVVNWTLVNRLIRTTVRVGVAYGSPVETVRDCLAKVVDENSDILSEPEPQIIFEDFGDNALIFDVYFWFMNSVNKPSRQIRSDVRFEIYRQLNDLDITIAFPQRDVHLDGELRVLSN